MDYEHYILQGEAKSTEFSDDRSYLLVQKANSYCACVGQTEECCLPKIDLIDDFGSLLYTCLDRCVWCLDQPNLDQTSTLSCACNLPFAWSSIWVVDDSPSRWLVQASGAASLVWQMSKSFHSISSHQPRAHLTLWSIPVPSSCFPWSWEHLQTAPACDVT